MRSRTRRHRCSTKRKRRPTSDADPLEVAAKALRHRDRSRRQVDDRLAKAGIEEATRADALETLERVGYVDDACFAAARAASLAGRGYGDEAIRHLLEADGISPDGTEAAIAALEPEVERARALAGRLGRTPKAAAQLRRKGFGADALEAAFGDLFAESDAGA